MTRRLLKQTPTKPSLLITAPLRVRRLAAQANVDTLILGHISLRYKDTRKLVGRGQNNARQCGLLPKTGWFVPLIGVDLVVPACTFV